MKDSEFWLNIENYPTCDEAYQHEAFTAWVKQIQLDAFKAGMEEAAKVADEIKMNASFETGDRIQTAILAVAILTTEIK